MYFLLILGCFIVRLHETRPLAFLHYYVIEMKLFSHSWTIFSVCEEVAVHLWHIKAIFTSMNVLLL